MADAVEPVSRPERVASEQNYRLLGVRLYGRGCHEHATAAGGALKTTQLNRVVSGDVTYNKMWVTKGAFAVVGPDCDGLTATSEYPLFTVRAGAAAPEFLRWAMTTDAFVRAATDSSRGSTSRRRLNPADFLKLSVPLPPLGEQRRIAAILSAVDAAIEATQAVIEQLYVVKKAMMAELLTRGLPGRHPRFKQTEIGEVPEQWAMTCVGDLATFSGGNGFRPPDWNTSGLPIIRIQNLNGSSNFNYYSRTPDPAWLVEPGELLFAWAGTRGASFGPTIWSGPRGVLNQHIYRISPHRQVRKEFLFYVLRLLTQEVEKRAHGFKESLVHLRKAELTGWPVALPPLDEQVEIVNILGSIDERQVAEHQQLAALGVTKQSLMASLLTGDIRVTPDEVAA